MFTDDADPWMGRWTNKDPIGFAGGDTSVYAYVGNDPVDNSDPLGLWGVAIGISAYAGFGPLLGVGAEGGAGVFWDISRRRVSVYTSSGNGLLLVPGLSAGVSPQVGVAWDGASFWNTGPEVGLNAKWGGSIKGSTVSRDTGFGALNGATFSGPVTAFPTSIGWNIHYFEADTAEQCSASY